MHVTMEVHTDGGARGNPGPAGIGYVIRYSLNEPGAVLNKKDVIKKGEYIGHATNNQAEYEAVIRALEKILSLGFDTDLKGADISFFLDSLLVVNQLNGLFKIKAPDLRNRLLKVRELEAQIGGEITYRHVPREQNTAADELVNIALDAGR